MRPDRPFKVSPHVHPNDRFFVVISGTLWVGSGETFNPASTVAMPPGSYVVHYANKPHYGMGPATTTNVEKR